MRVAVDTLVGFERFGDQIQMAAAAGLVNGTSIRREAWPRRLAAVQVETQGPIEVAGTQLAAGRFSIGNGAIWAGPSVLGWGHTGVVYGRSDENRTLQGEFPIRIISDGHWAETLSCDKVDEDFVLRCRLAKRAHWVRIVSSALLPAGPRGKRSAAAAVRDCDCRARGGFG